MAKIFRCPACRSKVSYEADVCFDCGKPLTENDKIKAKAGQKLALWGKVLFFSAILIYCVVFEMDFDSEPPDMSKAVSFEVIDVSESDAFNRLRVNLKITIPTYQQNKPEQYAQTAMKAALALSKVYKDKYPDLPAKVFVVQVTPSINTIIAKATFAIDKKGWGGDTDIEWEVKTLNSKLPPLEHFQTDNLWWEMRDDFQIPDPNLKGSTMTAENALREAIAEKLHIPFDKVWPAVVTTGEYFKR